MTHYIAMSGSCGCLPDWTALCESEAEAVDAATEMFTDLLTNKTEPQFRRELSNCGIVYLRHSDAGADYVEIVECDCETPEDHEG